MRIVGIGIDIVEIVRIEGMIARQGERVLERLFREEERRYCGTLREPARCYAARFAAKEAVAKAFGTGIGEHVAWLDLTILRDAAGKPSVQLSGAAAAYAQTLGITEMLVSLSHSEHYAVAQAMAVAP